MQSTDSNVFRPTYEAGAQNFPEACGYLLSGNFRGYFRYDVVVSQDFVKRLIFNDTGKNLK
ncbi:MAG: hypothetical protein OEV26_00995 [Gallionella sp.]|nr:hypothetical protein [Gallionella sp.]